MTSLKIAINSMLNSYSLYNKNINNTVKNSTLFDEDVIDACFGYFNNQILILLKNSTNYLLMYI